eukprot:GHUV01048357.1.p3 GENE.GHUV01048357.1~~GHUV01048357.1.p3  ORF type:complete len:110 (+),score=45.08 GHUV01048357.1:202-531(+)
MVARSLLADPQERDALLALPYSRNKKESTGADKMSNAIRGVAAAQGLDLKAFATPAAIKHLQPTAGTLNAAGEEHAACKPSRWLCGDSISTVGVLSVLLTSTCYVMLWR